MARTLPVQIDRRVLHDYHIGDIALVEVRRPGLVYATIGFVSDIDDDFLKLSNIDQEVRVGEIPERSLYFSTSDLDTLIKHLTHSNTFVRLNTKNLTRYHKGDKVMVEYHREDPKQRFTQVGYICDASPLLLITSNYDPRKSSNRDEKTIPLPLEDTINITPLSTKSD